MTHEIDSEQRQKIEKEYRRGREAMVIFAALSALIIVLFVMTLIFT